MDRLLRINLSKQFAAAHVTYVRLETDGKVWLQHLEWQRRTHTSALMTTAEAIMAQPRVRIESKSGLAASH